MRARPSAAIRQGTVTLSPGSHGESRLSVRAMGAS